MEHGWNPGSELMCGRRRVQGNISRFQSGWRGQGGAESNADAAPSLLHAIARIAEEAGQRGAKFGT